MPRRPRHRAPATAASRERRTGLFWFLSVLCATLLIAASIAIFLSGGPAGGSGGGAAGRDGGSTSDSGADLDPALPWTPGLTNEAARATANVGGPGAGGDDSTGGSAGGEITGQPAGGGGSSTEARAVTLEAAREGVRPCRPRP